MVYSISIITSTFIQVLMHAKIIYHVNANANIYHVNANANLSAAASYCQLKLALSLAIDSLSLNTTGLHKSQFIWEFQVNRYTLLAYFRMKYTSQLTEPNQVNNQSEFTFLSPTYCNGLTTWVTDKSTAFSLSYFFSKFHVKSNCNGFWIRYMFLWLFSIGGKFHTP